ncbi:MAG: gliding motility-associated C-terminal domain-containing protein, partial [Bacteroidales bacterium]|nr:gliding motility-associated C-terminal domain-containing protein [Candidatus Physcocola equi]
DKCCEVTTTITRDDNKALEGNYGLGNTVVLFDFADDHDNHKQCSVTVIVKDMIPPVVTCPGLAQTNFDCINDTTVAYATYEEFKQAGGSVDDESKIIPESLGHFDVVDGDFCSADITRNYYLLTTRRDTVFCENPQHMHAEDTVAPEYVGILPGGESISMGCDSYIDEPLEVTANDKCDPDAKVNMTRTSTQSSDPNDCSYYTFDITYTYVAVDRCGNEAAPITYTIHVKDTVAPVVHEPADWKDEMYPTYLKNCEFGVPDITALLPKDSIYQNCGDASTLKIWQTPESGTLISETTIVYLHIEDVCGNDTVMEKVVRVQPREEIIKVSVATDPYVCGDDESLSHPTSAENSLSNAQIRDYNGVVYYQDYDGSWVPVPTTVFWDYYRGSISEENVVYSNNELTYADKFADAQDLYSEEGMKAFGKYNLLLRRNQSDTYYFVASDTITGCSDTAEVYIDVRERPRIDLAGGLWKLCEGDTLDINGEFKSTFPACVDPLGGTITEEGWLVNDSVYKHGEPVNYDNGIDHTAIYYAINECGTTRSDSSLYVSCSGDLPSYADSLEVAGSAENMKLFQEDRLIIADSVILDVYTHFDPTQVLLSTNPQDKPRIWEGENAELVLSLPYKPTVYKWYRVVNAFDGAGETVYDREGNIVSGGSYEDDDEDLGDLSKVDGNGRYVFTLETPSDSSSYYVLVGNGVCPTEASNLVSIDVMHQLPTAITPYDKDGLNDTFMKGYYVIIFNRYGQKIVESHDGWDGTYRGLLADPGVYYYTIVMKSGVVHNGAIEVVKIK